MGDNKTIIIRTPIFGDQALKKKSHASLVVLKGEEIGRDFRLRKRGIVIGRSTTADICLPGEGTSREHARVDYKGTGAEGAIFTLTDMGSTNHTFVNSAQVESVQLRDGDKVRIGDYVLKFVVLDDIEAKFHADVRDLISYDRLTGLLTKESLYLAFERELERCLRYGLPLGVLMMDLDRFKSVNDGHGHQMGSHVLGEVGQIINRCVRVADASARYGGEEFLSYLVETDTAGVEVVAERVRSAMEAHTFVLDDASMNVTISIGVAVAPGHGETIKALVAAADRALYQANEDNNILAVPRRDGV